MNINKFWMTLLCSVFVMFNLNAESEEVSQTRNDTQVEESEVDTQVTRIDPNFTRFTGKVIGNQVRVRLEPNLESNIVSELNAGEYVLVTGQSDDFLQVSPPNEKKLYVFRTFVLDDTIEGHHVNVRLEPNLDSPVITQLNTGDKVEGSLVSENSKWVQITPPENVRFYISKDYVENVGDDQTLARLEARQKEVKHLLNSAYLISQAELRKPFEEVNFDHMAQSFKKITEEYEDFPSQVEKAKDALALISDAYLQKKISFLESKTENTSTNWKAKNAKLNAEIQAYQQRLEELEKQLGNARDSLNSEENSNLEVLTLNDELTEEEEQTLIAEDVEQTDMMRVWAPMEEAYYHNWAATNLNKNLEDFLREEKRSTTKLKGIVEPFYRPIKNKPGDFILRDPNNSLPIAYLYSTKVNLQDKVGEEISLEASERPNNNFAFPAFHVWTVE